MRPRWIIVRYIAAIVVFAVAAFVRNGLIWVVFVCSIMLVVASGYSLSARALGRPSRLMRTTEYPWWVDAVLLVVFVLPVVSAVPALLFDDPFWAIDHVFRAIAVAKGDAA